MRSKRSVLAVMAMLGLMGSGLAQAATETPTPPPPPVAYAGPPIHAPSGADGSASPLSLGSASTDLTYTPLTPCRAFDTRQTGVGAFTGTQSFYLNNSTVSLVTQGGSAVDCGMPQSNEAVAVVINLTAVSTSAGFTTAFAFGGTVPNSSVLNWSGNGYTVANTTVIPLCRGCGPDISINNFNNSFVIGDVMGYFRESGATALQTTVLSNTLNVPAGNVSIQNGNVTTAACPAGYTLTGGGADWAANFFDLYLVGSAPVSSNTAWRGTYRSERSSAIDFFVYAICARVPGI